MLGAEELFTPKSIAVIGASADPEKIGHMVLTNLHAAGYAGSIYAVNARGGEALGHHFYKSVLEIAGPVDLAVITIPAGHCTFGNGRIGKKGNAGGSHHLGWLS